MATDPQHRRRCPRLLARVLAPLLAALVLVLTPSTLVPGAGAGTAEAVSVCQGRPTRTITFATGELRLYRTRHYACAVTVAHRPGARRPMAVSLQPRGGRPAVRAGRFDRQAGPVTVHALNRCVRARGSVAGRGTSTDWILC
ncbi:hypothetical protein AMK27_27530 [Streptomyces sp. CB02009]|uniref:hypothetical protein n=1 Tax=Streptomyces sp. CB02009 TaxID=1703938 RepID=UPI00093D123A|nr:hypothetical protein [Streptomyces sp. CB02009]OKJ54904.1 hypothetical protein AMK27_27530 [Streptomyces sp. CB02009]